MNEQLNLPKLLYGITGTFEFELLIELLLRQWNHPLALNEEYRNDLMEAVAEALNQAGQGKSLTEEMKPNEVNMIFAAWHIETSLVANEQDQDLKKQREQWLLSLRRSLPSCFCNQDLLD